MAFRGGILETIVTALATFAATNVDDLVLLTLFFAEAPTEARPQVVIGQYLGFVALVAVSLGGLLGRLVLPREWLGLLGAVPIAIGMRGLLHRHGEDGEVQTVSQPDRTAVPSLLGAVLAPRTYAVAAVTFANGGDNIGLYAPLFANSDLTRLAVTVAVFLVLVAVWCAAANRLARHPQVAALLARHGRIAVPFVLIALGITIIAEAGTLSLLPAR